MPCFLRRQRQNKQNALGPFSCRNQERRDPAASVRDTGTALGGMPQSSKQYLPPRRVQLVPPSGGSYLQPGDGGWGIPMGCTGDHQLPAHLLEVFLLGAHREGGGVLEDRDAQCRAWQQVGHGTDLQQGRLTGTQCRQAARHGRVGAAWARAACTPPQPHLEQDTHRLGLAGCAVAVVWGTCVHSQHIVVPRCNDNGAV